ncbi:Chorismate mutase 1, chloroplastic [Sesamum angolense]|uniref:chorismate mutase n=1 Tax=Sesamum angolense TaxID=2727404 RepID=A0AAE2C5G3_9LAMI|nr:Chorismate mutase 1, chloroplastic [Sesamum angolense]
MEAKLLGAAFSPSSALATPRSQHPLTLLPIKPPLPFDFPLPVMAFWQFGLLLPALVFFWVFISWNFDLGETVFRKCHKEFSCGFRVQVGRLVLRSILFPGRLARRERVDETQSYTLEGIRNSLIRQEDSIIFSLVERAQLCYNAETYDPDAFAMDGFHGSLVEYMVKGTEKLHAKVGRYKSPDEHPFFPNDLPEPLLPPMEYPQESPPRLVKKGDDGNYGSAASCDTICLQALSKRIHYGKFVAEAKFRASPDVYKAAIRAQDAAQIMDLLTYPAVEEAITKRVEMKTRKYGQEVNMNEVGGNSEPVYKINPTIVPELYGDWIMPLTKQVQKKLSLNVPYDGRIIVMAISSISLQFPPMATALSSISPPAPAPHYTFASWKAHKPPPSFWTTKPFVRPVVHSIQIQSPFSAPCSSNGAAAAAAVEDGRQSGDLPISIDVLKRFIDLNLGIWIGSFHQFDSNGNLLHKISTKLSASSYGEAELTSLIQSLLKSVKSSFGSRRSEPTKGNIYTNPFVENKSCLILLVLVVLFWNIMDSNILCENFESATYLQVYIKQPPLSTSDPEDESEWFEYKIKETNMFTVDKYQQIGFFPEEKAFALRYQTAGMLETVIRQGVLGEDDTGEESPRNLKLPSRRPAIVCENCLYSLEKDARVRAFHIMDPQGILNATCIPGRKRKGSDCSSFLTILRMAPHLGTWKGHSITKRSGVYGATIAEADTIAILEMNEDGQLIQDIRSTSGGSDVTTSVHWMGSISNNLVTFDGGFQLTLLPGGIYMGCPSDVAKSVQESKSFHLEFCWLESPGTRQRLVRTYDVEGLAVSSTYFLETKQ